MKRSVSILGILVPFATLALLPGCGGGGGGGSKTGGSLGEATITVVGTPGQLSQTPEQANAGNGLTPPPSFAPTATVENQWFRLEYPFAIDPATIYANDPALKPFSYLTGNITITDVNGAHVPGIALVNGVDAQGVNRSLQMPHDIDTAGVDHNLGANVFLYVADADGNLATKAPFGGYGPDPLNPNAIVELQTASIDTVRINVSSTNNVSINAAWSFHIGAGTDTRVPYVTGVVSEQRDPTDPLNPASIAATGSLLISFSKPMVPQSVGHSAVLNGFPFDANLPNPALSPPYPDTTITATVNTKVGKLWIPFDCAPVNVNNLTTYRLRPLITLPPNTSIDAVERAFTTNSGLAAFDLAGNLYNGQDANNDGNPDGANFTSSFSVGPGPAIVNIPVSPEVVYWAPSSGDGIGAIDLNGWGFTTNTPGANAGNRDRAQLITKNWLDQNGCEANPGGLNLVSGIGIWAHPNLPTPTDPCTLLPMKEFAHNHYWYPIGVGAFAYGPVANFSNGEGGKWEFPSDPGNDGTPFPGVNEGSSGFETLCRDSTGSPILTGLQFGDVGSVQDMIVGEFLDRVYSDHLNFHAANSLHVSFFGGKAPTQGRNTIADPPAVNPPPTRYWVGLPQLDVVLDPAHPTNPALVLESEEPFTLAGAARANGYIHLRPNTTNPNAADQTIFPHLNNGPSSQSATQVFTFAARQQIGNFLYATDATSREVQAINSNTMRVVSSIPLPDPTGLAISPDMAYLYVTNLGDDSMSVIVADPTNPSFHQEIARMTTGSGPRAIAVQPEVEDIFVCNYTGNTVSIIDPRSLSIRKTLDALIQGPFDVEVSERQEQPNAPHPFGWACGLYFAYVSNFIGNSVVVYESGPDGAQGIGINNIRGSLPTDDSAEPIIAPRGLCFSPFANPLGLSAGGVFIAHQDDLGFGRVSHVQFTQQAIFGPLPIQPPPGFFIPPGFTDRVFEVTGSWGGTDSSRLAGTRPSDVVLCDLNVATYQSNPAGAPNGGGASTPPAPERTGFVNSKNHNRLGAQSQATAWTPDRLYVGFDDSDVIQVLDPAQAGVVVNTIEHHHQSGTKKLMSFWRQ